MPPHNPPPHTHILQPTGLSPFASTARGGPLHSSLLGARLKVLHRIGVALQRTSSSAPPNGDATAAATTSSNDSTELGQSNHLNEGTSGGMGSSGNEQGSDYDNDSSSLGQRQAFAGGDDLAVAAGVKVLLCLLQ